VFFGRSGAPAGTSVTVASFDGRMVRRTCTAAVASDHTWSCTQTLSDGGYSWTAQVASGGPVSREVDFIVNTVGYPAPTIDHTPSPTNDAKPVLTGTVDASLAKRGFYLEVTENGIAICIVDPIQSTDWACPLSAKLADGPHLLTADVDFRNGDEATPWGNPNAFVVKTSIGKPTLTAIPTPTSLSAIPFSGTGEPAAVVTVAQGTSVLCQATVSAGGRWSCMAAEPLADGPHAVSVRQQDAAGNTSSAVSATFVVDTHVPGSPTLDAPQTPTADPRVTFTGTGEAGAQVSVLDSYSRLLCSATLVAGSGWSCTPTSGVADGDYLVTAFQVTAVGKRSGPSASVPLSVRTLLAPLFEPLASPTRETSPLLTGHAKAGAIVSVYLGENPICGAQTDGNASWSCHPSEALADGAYLLQARVSDAESHLSGPSVARALVVDTTPPAAPILEQPVSPTRKHQPVLSGSAEAGSSVTVVDAATDETICQAPASAAGAFRCTPAGALGLGEYRVTARAMDQAGNTSLPAPSVGIVVSEAVPPPPSIDSPANGTELEKRRPVIAGQTLPGTLVEVSVDGAVYVAQVAAGGQWTLLPPADLALGEHEISASATDPEQNVSDPTTSRFAVVETGVARGGCSSGGTPETLLAAFALLFAGVRKRRGVSIAGALAVAAVPSLVRAQNIDVSSFRPASGGDGYAAVEGARPPLAGDSALEVRTWTDYAVRPLTFVSSSGSEQALVRSRTTQWLDVQVHLFGPLSIAAQVPLTVSTGGDLSRLPPSSRGPSELLSGFADLRLTPRIALLRQDGTGIDLATQLSLEFPTGRAQSLSSDGSVHVEGLIALGRGLGAVPAGALELLANAYVRLRPAREFLGVKYGSEAGLRAGLGYEIAPLRAWVPRRLYAEFEGRSFLRGGFAAGTAPAEWRLGGTLCPVGNLAVDLAGGSALSDGVGSPRARFLFGFAWSPAACARRTDALAKISPTPVVAPAAEPPAEPPRPVAEALPLPPPPMVVDRDGDGIADADDACPDHAGPAENHGCPPGIRQRVIVSATSLEILDRVHFATGMSRIERRSHSLLDQVAAVLNSHPHLLLVQVEGHTDDRGSGAINILLSQARATAVADYLISKGVDRDRLIAKGFGPTHPVGSNGTAAGRAANRRVAFTVLKTEARVIEAERPPDS
jgi:outer membrane protein OmpA-like peptidoglycan-associated protein